MSNSSFFTIRIDEILEPSHEIFFDLALWILLPKSSMRQ